MRRTSKAIVTALLCGAIAVSASSCASGQTYPLTVDGEKIRAGVYILEQSNAVDKAKDKLKEEQPDLDMTAEGFSYLGQTVEGKKFEEWVDDKTIELCRNYVAIERLFNEYGLSLTKEETDEINSNVKSVWNDESQYAEYIYGVKVIGQYYEKLGVGDQSFTDYQLMSKKSEKIFDYLYGENGTKAATQEEINEKLASDYLAVNYLRYDLENGEGAQAIVDKIKNGATFEEAYRDYMIESENEKAAKEAAAAAEGENGEAAGSADEGTKGADSGETTTAAAETTTAAAETTVESSESSESSESAESTTTAVETAGEAAGSSESTTAAAETTGDTTEGTDDAQPVTPPETDSLIKILKKSENAPSEEFIKQVSEMEVGEVKVITITEGEVTKDFVVQKLDILSKPEKTTEEVKTIRSELKQDEFTELINNAAKDLKVTEDASKSMYKIDKILNAR